MLDERAESSSKVESGARILAVISAEYGDWGLHALDSSTVCCVQDRWIYPLCHWLWVVRRVCQVLVHLDATSDRWIHDV